MIKRLLLASAALATPGALLAAEWREAETAHFRIFSSAPEKELTRFATRLEMTDALMRRAQGAPEELHVNKVRVFVVPSLDDVQRAVGMVGSGIGGFYTVNEHGPFAVTPRRTGADYGSFTPEVVLFHEYGHHFQLQYFPKAYPAWYVEGSAELYSTVDPRPDGTVIFGKAASHRGRSLAYARWVPVADLLTKPADKYPDDGDFYGQSWLLTHYLTFSPKRKGQLASYLRATVSGKTPAEAAAVFGDLNVLSGELRKYFEAANFPAKAVPMALPDKVIHKLRVLSPAEAELIPETIAFRDHDFSEIEKGKDRAKEKTDREKHLDRLRGKVARFGNDPYAMRLLADAEFVAGNYAQSRAAVDRLIAADPANPGGLYRKAALLLEDAGKAKDADRGRLAREARTLAVRANRIDNDDPQPLVAFYQSYVAAGERPTADAMRSLQAAVEGVPQDGRVRWMLVEALASERRYKEAAAVIEPLAFDPHKSPSRERALKRLEELKKSASKSAGAAKS